MASPGDVIAPRGAGIEWSPAPWAHIGRRPPIGFGALSPRATFTGSDERLFTSFNSVCEQLFEGACLRPRSLEAWVEALQTRVDYFDAQGISYRHLVVPEGHAICSDAIAGAPLLSEQRPLRQILAAAGDRVRERVIYPLQALIDARTHAQTSLPHDVHPSTFGGYVLFRELAATLPAVIDPATIVARHELTVREALIAGDVARHAGRPARRVKVHMPPHVPHKQIVKGTTFDNNQVDVLETETPHLPRLVMFRTSNSTMLFPYLLRYFSRIATVASVAVLYDFVESERPDVVISEMPERYFAHSRHFASETDFGCPPTDANDAFEERTGLALPLQGAAAT